MRIALCVCHKFCLSLLAGSKRDCISMRFCGFLLCNLKQRHNKYTHSGTHTHTHIKYIGSKCGFVYHIIVIDKFGECCNKNVGTFFTHIVWSVNGREGEGKALAVDMLNRREESLSRADTWTGTQRS